MRYAGYGLRLRCWLLLFVEQVNNRTDALLDLRFEVPELLDRRDDLFGAHCFFAFAAF